MFVAFQNLMSFATQFKIEMFEMMYKNVLNWPIKLSGFLPVLECFCHEKCFQM